MKVKVFPSSVEGTLKAPSSKSCTQRALAAALLTPGTSVIENAGNSNDEIAARNIIKSLGADIREENGIVTVRSGDSIFKIPERGQQSRIIDCGESGLSMRMFAPVASLFNFKITMNGRGSILSRPMDFLDRYLPHLGVKVKSNHGKVPVTLHGPLQAKNITVDGAMSSQFLTGLLFAFCKAAKEPVTISVTDLTSRPYIDLTISVLQKFGFKVTNNNYKSFDIIPAQQSPAALVRYTVEGDWSNAAFLLVAGAVAGNITLSGMDRQSTQGDKRIMDALHQCGADVLISGKGIQVSNKTAKVAFVFDATQCPDLFPPLVALAANCVGVSRITGVSRLLHKESNRALALRDEFVKMGVKIEVVDDTMLVHGTPEIKGVPVSSHNDHRIAMAAAVAALNADGAMEIADAQAINKSYPGFYDDLKKLNARVENVSTEA